MQVLEKILQFSCSKFSQTDHFIQSYSCFVTQMYSIPILAVTVTFFVRIISVRVVNHFLEIILDTFSFLFLLPDE